MALMGCMWLSGTLGGLGAQCAIVSQPAIILLPTLMTLFVVNIFLAQVPTRCLMFWRWGRTRGSG